MAPAHPDDAFALGPAIRAVDKKELHLGWEGSDDTSTLLSTCIEVSDVAYSISDKSGTIHGLWGHGHWVQGPVHAGLGYVWMLTDYELFDKYAVTMTKYARRVVFPYLDRTYGSYGNFVLSENLVHARWLLRGGFKRAAPVNMFGESWGLYLRSRKPKKFDV